MSEWNEILRGFREMYARRANCGCVWLCPSCDYRDMRASATQHERLFEQMGDTYSDEKWQSFCSVVMRWGESYIRPMGIDQDFPEGWQYVTFWAAFPKPTKDQLITADPEAWPFGYSPDWMEFSKFGRMAATGLTEQEYLQAEIQIQDISDVDHWIAWLFRNSEGTTFLGRFGEFTILRNPVGASIRAIQQIIERRASRTIQLSPLPVNKPAQGEMVAHDARPLPVERPSTKSKQEHSAFTRVGKSGYVVMLPNLSETPRNPSVHLMGSLQMVLGNIINALFDPDHILTNNDSIEGNSSPASDSEEGSVAQCALDGLAAVSMFAEVGLDFIEKIDPNETNAQATDLLREICEALLLISSEVGMSNGDAEWFLRKGNDLEALNDARSRLENLRTMLGMKLKTYCSKLAIIPFDILKHSTTSNTPQRPPAQGEVKQAAPPTPSHSADFTSLNWFGHNYIFSKGQQAETIKLLYQAWRTGGHGLSQESISATLKSTNERLELAKVFRKKRAEGKGYEPHPAWGTLIQSVSRGVYRLVEPESAKNPQ